MSAQQPPSAAGEVPAAASGDADGDADAAELPVYDEALHRAAFKAQVQQYFDDSILVKRQSLSLAEVDMLTPIVDGWEEKPKKQRGFEKEQAASFMGRMPGSVYALIQGLVVHHEPALPVAAGTAGPSEAAAQGRRVLFEKYKDGEVEVSPCACLCIDVAVQQLCQ